VTGSNQAAIFIPVVVMPVLAAWLFVVFYADSHPRWHVHRSPSELTGAARGSAIATGEAPRVTAARDGAPVPGTPPPAQPLGPQPRGGTT
jgi:hypothetical protein